jgi:hypothetical protein
VAVRGINDLRAVNTLDSLTRAASTILFGGICNKLEFGFAPCTRGVPFVLARQPNLCPRCAGRGPQLPLPCCYPLPIYSIGIFLRDIANLHVD